MFAHLHYFCYALQASEDYFTFETENIVVSVDSPQVIKPIFLSMGLRQTLLIPPDVSNDWILVSETQNNANKRTTGGQVIVNAYK